MPDEVCCDAMRTHAFGEDETIVFNAKLREYGLPVPDSGGSYIEMNFCPWCGKALASSLRDEWFDELERRGIDPSEDTVPDELSDERWYKSSSTTQ